MTERKPRVLLVDSVSGAMRRNREVLVRAGFQVECRRDGVSALADVGEFTPDAVAVATELSTGLSGLETLRYLKRRYPQLTVVALVGRGDESTAAEAMRLGAYSFLGRPCDPGELASILCQAVNIGSAEREGREQCLASASAELVGGSAAMLKVRELVADVAPTLVTVLLLGETGTGKELVAKAIHSASARSGGRFVAVNCAAIPETLIEAELFGHVRGAFTGAERDRVGKLMSASGGTLLLDEVGELPMQVQPKLLRFLEDGCVTPLGSDQPLEVDVRFVAATHRDLKSDVEAGRFREDLYYRLNVVPIELPPLRDRPEDVMELVRHLLPRLCARHGKIVNTIEPPVLNWLAVQEWPGNVRELENALERLVVFCRDGILRLREEQAEDSLILPFQDEKQRVVEEFERAYLHHALAACQGRVGEVARRTGISQRQLYNLLQKYGLGKSCGKPS